MIRRSVNGNDHLDIDRYSFQIVSSPKIEGGRRERGEPAEIPADQTLPEIRLRTAD